MAHQHENVGKLTVWIDGFKPTCFFTARGSALDAVDGSSTGARAPWMWVLLGAYDSEEPDHANHYDYRSRYREVGFSSPWRWCEWRCCCSPSIEAAVCAVVLSEAASVPHWYRGLCVVALLVA
jgi:hypothetical protein